MKLRNILNTADPCKINTLRDTHQNVVMVTTPYHNLWSQIMH